jgi:hypothetical protein
VSLKFFEPGYRVISFVLAHDDRMRTMEGDSGDSDYYHEDDFCVGHTINVFGAEEGVRGGGEELPHEALILQRIQHLW